MEEQALEARVSTLAGRLRAIGWADLLSPRLVLPAIILLCLALYAPTLAQWFKADDFWFLQSAQVTPLGKYVVEALDFRDADPVPEFTFYRPLYLLTFRVTYELFGLDAAGYRAVNLGLHLGSVVLLWFIAFRLTKRLWAAHLSALIFALHPAFTDPLTWISNGNSMMAVFAYLSSLLLFMKWAEGPPRTGLYYIGWLVALTAALLYHPATLPLAGVLPAYYFLVHLRPIEALRARRWLAFVPMAVIAAIYVGIQMWVRRHEGQEVGFQVGWHMYDNYVRYFGLALLPIRESRGIVVWASAGIFTMTAVLLTRWRWPLVPLFAILWFYASLAPDSVFALGAFKRLLYIPGASLSIFLVVVTVVVLDAAPDRLRAALRLGTLSMVLAGTVGAAALVLHIGDIAGRDSDAAHDFVGQMREQVPRMDEGGTLYVVNPPLNLIIFTDNALINAVELYYGDVTVKRISSERAQQIAPSLGPKDRIFYYQPEGP